MRKYIIGAAAALAFLVCNVLSLWFGSTLTWATIIPSCAEDEIIVGIGDFGSDGYWDSYICFGADD